MAFTSLHLHPALLRAVERMGFAVPTPIQKDAIPPAVEGRDLLACAVTGSGKTAAFLLPILHRLVDTPRGATRALIVTPTRELAAQIDEHRRDLGRFTRIDGAAIYGGVGMGPQGRRSGAAPT
jgi:ATP-dependent RNA helicase RhlE